MNDATAAAFATQEAVAAFAVREVAPRAAAMDREGRFSPELLKFLAEAGYLGWGFGDRGQARDWGMLHAEIGRFCTSTRCILTAHQMAAGALGRWGTRELRREWMPRLSAGRALAAFALSEAAAGSDPASMETSAEPIASGYRLRGVKQWITAGQLADAFLVFANCNGAIAAFWISRDLRGVVIRPIAGLLGARAAMLAELRLEDCLIPPECAVGSPGTGMPLVAAGALDFGRLAMAFGCLGMAEKCLETAGRYAAERRQFGKLLGEHQLVQRILTEMIVDTRAARLLCGQAASLRDAGDPAAPHETLIAKYFSSRAAARAAAAAVQILGARGCTEDYPVERFFRDAKIMEIVEGSNEMQQIMIARNEAFEA